MSRWLGRSQWSLLVAVVSVLVSHNVQAQSVSARNAAFRPQQRTAPGNFVLGPNHGPWMIFVASFAGPTAESEAESLVLELRKRWQIAAYTYREHYDFTDSVQGNGLTPDGQPLRMKYRLPIAYDEIAVLAGDFPTADDPNLQRTMKFLKTCQPTSILQAQKSGKSTQRFAGFRSLQRRLSGDQEKIKRGPLAQCFATRNPLLPQEFFTPKGIDSFVLSMNQGVPYSLLNCPKKYSVRIATFRGTVVIDQQKVQEIERTGRMESRLAQAAEKSHALTEILRKRGVEAYEFHDRHESIVTVGSFDSLGVPGENGVLELHPGIVRIMQTYGASQKLLPGLAAAGLMPKSVNGITLDVQPLPVEVPRRSIAVDYAR